MKNLFKKALVATVASTAVSSVFAYELQYFDRKEQAAFYSNYGNKAWHVDELANKDLGKAIVEAWNTPNGSGAGVTISVFGDPTLNGKRDSKDNPSIASGMAGDVLSLVRYGTVRAFDGAASVGDAFSKPANGSTLYKGVALVNYTSTTFNNYYDISSSFGNQKTYLNNASKDILNQANNPNTIIVKAAGANNVSLSGWGSGGGNTDRRSTNGRVDVLNHALVEKINANQGNNVLFAVAVNTGGYIQTNHAKGLGANVLKHTIAVVVDNKQMEYLTAVDQSQGAATILASSAAILQGKFINASSQQITNLMIDVAGKNTNNLRDLNAAWGIWNGNAMRQAISAKGLK